MLHAPELVPEIQRYYKPTIAISATIMGIGFWVYFVNIFITARQAFKKSP